jgi:hypothetical protein
MRSCSNARRFFVIKILYPNRPIAIFLNVFLESTLKWGNSGHFSTLGVNSVIYCCGNFSAVIFIEILFGATSLSLIKNNYLLYNLSY